MGCMREDSVLDTELTVTCRQKYVWQFTQNTMGTVHEPAFITPKRFVGSTKLNWTSFKVGPIEAICICSPMKHRFFVFGLFTILVNPKNVKEFDIVKNEPT